MYKILFFVLVFLVLIPLVWRIVNKVFFKVSDELSDDRKSADDVIGSFLRQKSQMEERQHRFEEQSRKAKEETDKLNGFSGNEGKEETKE